MTGELAVLLDREEVGMMFRDARGRVRFGYDPRYRRAATPLSLSVLVGATDLHDVGAWVEGLLPDNEEVLRSWAEMTSAASEEAFDLLATGIGRDCAGAVRFCAPDDVVSLLGRAGGVEPLSEEDVARRLRGLEVDGARWHADRGGMFSLSGAQPKIALRLENGRWGQPWGDEPTTHILKPPRPHLDRRVTSSIHINEHLCQAAAAAVGIRAATTWLETLEDQETLVVERFDRLGTRRIHTEDLCQALGVRPRHKYQYDGGPGPVDITRLLRDAGRPGDDLRFCDALAYNWLIGATDSHAKNFSVVLAGTDATFAPLYDTASWIPYAPDPSRARFAMQVGDGYRLVKDSPRRDWAHTAGSMGIDSAAATLRIVDLSERLPQAFAAAAAQTPEVFRVRAETVAQSIVGHIERNRRSLME